MPAPSISREVSRHEGETGELRGRLEAFIEANLPENTNLELRSLERMASGFSRENWRFDAAWTENGSRVERELILRRDPQASVVETDRRIEFAALQALSHGDVPTPEAYWADPTGERLGRPSLVMRRYRGVGDRFVLSREDGYELATRLELARTGLSHLVALHASDWHSLGFADFVADPGADAASVAIDHWEGQLRRQALEPQPELISVASWLRAHAPISAAETTIVHGDWKPGNWLIEQGRFVAALDWEMVHLGDPLEDLGWVTNPMRATMHEIPGHYERAEIVERYRALSQRRFSDEHLRFWNLFAAFKIAIVEITGIHSFCSGLAERPWTADLRLHRYLLEEIAR